MLKVGASLEAYFVPWGKKRSLFPVYLKNVRKKNMIYRTSIPFNVILIEEAKEMPLFKSMFHFILKRSFFYPSWSFLTLWF